MYLKTKLSLYHLTFCPRTRTRSESVVTAVPFSAAA